MLIRPFDPTHVPRPRIETLFDVPIAPTPLDLEIGCGVGWHPIHYAQTHPDRYLVAIEHTAEKFGKFKRRFERNGNPSNLLPVHANAISWVTYHIPLGSLDRIFLLYPNPTDYWYERPFFGRLLECMKPGATLTLATNLEAYAVESKKYLLQAWGLHLIEESTPTEPRTHFEKKYIESGQKCFNQVWKKI